MADTKVSNLDALTTPANSDVLYIVDAGVSKKITYSNLFSNVNGTVATLTNDVSDYTFRVAALSAFYEELDVTNTSTNIKTLSSNVTTLQTETDDLYIIRNYATRAYTHVTTISAGLTQAVTIGSTTLNFTNGVLMSVT